MKVWLTRNGLDVGIWFTFPVWNVDTKDRWNGEWGFEFPEYQVPAAFVGLPFPGAAISPACVEANLVYVNPREEAKPQAPRAAKTDWLFEFGLFLLAVQPGGAIQLERIL